MSFDLGEFYDLCGEIEHKMGLLRANEAVREWWDNWQAELGNVPRYGYLPFHSHVGSSEYWVDFSYFGMPAIEDVESAEAQPAAEAAAFQRVAEVAEEVWNAGRTWGDSLADYLFEICAPITRAQKPALQDLSEEFKSVRDSLQHAVPTNWKETPLDLSEWVGGSSDAFGDFMNQLHDQVDEYAAFIAHACAWWASACALVLQTQSGVNGFLREVDRALHEQLVQWAETQGNPMDISGEVNPKVLDVITLGGAIADVIPPVAKVKETVSNAIVVGDAALDLFGVEPELTLPAPFKVRKAEEIWTGLTETLYNDYRVKMDDALEDMAGQSTSAIGDIRSQGGAFLPLDVGTGARQPDWTHPLEG